MRRIGLAAKQVAEPSAFEAARAVIGPIAAAVGSVDQSIVIIGVEQRTQRVRQMVIVERDAGRPQALIGKVARRVEGHSRIADQLARHHADQFAFRPPTDRHRPSRTRGEVLRGIVDARQRDGLDLFGRESGLRETFCDGFARKASAVALDPSDPLLRDGGDQPVVVIERRPGVVGVVDA